MRVPRLVVTCEHGGNRVPAGFRPLFRSRRQLLESHRGFDHGALATARLFARRLEAPIHAVTVTRLLVDTNRSLHHRSLFSDAAREMTAAQKAEVLRRYYHPHRDTVERSIGRWIAAGHDVVHIASHSFTPVLDGEPRTAEVAWLYDPGRRQEKLFVNRWRDTLRRIRPDLRLRRNYPYRGVFDGLTTHLRRIFPASRYVGIELEVNQDAADTQLRQALVASLEAAFGGASAKR